MFQLCPHFVLEGCFGPFFLQSQERSDPYVIVKVGAIQRRPVIGGISGGNLDRRWLDRTPTIDNDLNPDWKDWVGWADCRLDAKLMYLYILSISYSYSVDDVD